MDVGNQSSILHVLDTLRQACSQDATVLKPAEKQLKLWETERGFYNIISTIFLNHDIEVNVRWLAVLLFKNGIDRYWRRNAPNAIVEEEKVETKRRLIERFDEPSPQIATQLAVLIAKIARIDCPRQWPTLIPTVLQAVRSHDDLSQQRAILTLHHVTKTLASKCLANDRKVFTQMTTDILGYIVNIWETHLSQFFQHATDYNDEGMAKSIERVILTSKVIRKQVVFGSKDMHTSPVAMSFVSDLFNKLPQILARLIRKQVVFGSKDIHTSPVAMSFVSDLFNKLPQILTCRHSLWGNHAILSQCERLVLLLTKILHEVLEHHPDSFLTFIDPCLRFVLAFTFHESTGGLRFERFTVNCFNLMKLILHCDKYNPSKESNDPTTIKAQAVIREFFTPTLLTEMCRRLVTHYFLLKCDDILTWESDPEAYAQEEIGDSYKFSLRPCTEVLLLTLFKTNRQCLSAVLIDLVKSLQGPCDPDDMPAMLGKEAVYNAVGLVSYDLFDDIDFDSWFTSHLLPELAVQHPNYRIIRRRVIWLIGQWVGVKMSTSLRPSLYEAIIPLLYPTEDTVVRLEAANTLKSVDDYEFKTDAFLPYLNTLFGHLFQLLKDVCECDSKMCVLHVISFVIERVGSHIVPYASTLIQYLPVLWQDAQDHNMLRCAIVSTLIHLVQGLGSSCVDMFDFIIPVIQMATDLTEAPHIYLMEDGIELWLMAMHHTPSAPNNLVALFGNMPPLLELGSESLIPCLKITAAYILLGGDSFLSKYSDILVSSLTSLSTDVKYEGLSLILEIVEQLVIVFPTQGPQLFTTLLTNGFMAILQKDQDYPLLIPSYLSIFSRILLSNHQTFLEFVGHVATQFERNSEHLLSAYLTTIFDRIEMVVEPERRKLIALAVVSLLSLKLPVVLEKFGLVINLCVEVLHDISRPQSDTELQIDSLVITDDDDNYSFAAGDVTQHDLRLRLLRHRDPVHTTELRNIVRSQLGVCREAVGEANFTELMNNTDSEVVLQLQHLLT